MSLKRIHPSAEPKMKVRRMLKGMNHLNIKNHFYFRMTQNCTEEIILHNACNLITHSKRMLSKVTVLAKLLKTRAGLNTKNTI